MESKIKKQVFERDKFTCQKCGFNEIISDLEIHHIQSKIFSGDGGIKNLVTLCSICNNYAPDLENQFLKYLEEKIDGKILKTFRSSLYSISKKTQTGMGSSFEKGNHVSRAPKGYILIDKKLIPSQDSKEIENIFEEFLNTEISLTKLAKKNNLTNSGIKKLLQNTTYIGKIKFGNQETEGKHIPLLSKQLFTQVQEKLKSKGWIN
jgi:hypothetical protein